LKPQLLIRSLPIFVLLALSACAENQSFKKGQLLLEQNNPEAAFIELQKAVDEQPKNVEYLRYFYRQRESYTNKQLREADAAVINHQWPQAKASYERVIKVDQQNQRAQQGLVEIERGQQHEALLAEANTLINDGNDDAALAKINAVLAEDPQDTDARSLRSQIAGRKTKKDSPEARLNARFHKPVTLEFKEANIRTVFQMLSKTSGVNFVLDKELPLDLKVSIFVKDTSIESALQNILATSQLSQRILNDNSVLIYPSKKQSDYQQMMVKTFYLKNVDPKMALSLLQTVVKTKELFLDEKLNIIVMRDTADNVHLAQKLMSTYDTSDPEVMLDVQVLEVSANKLRTLGIQYPTQVSIGVVGSGGTAGQLSFDEAQHFNGSNGLIKITDPTLVLNLSANDSDTKLLANPQIRVKNRKKAKIHIGDRVPVITTTSSSTGFVGDSVSYLDVGLKLEVEPTIMVGNEVSMDVSLEVSSITDRITSKNGTLAYQLGTRNADTTLRLKNGETQILAGLINTEESSSANKVPGLADLPIIGRLFSSKQSTNKKTEIVLLITPRVIRNIEQPDSDISEFVTGTESGNLGVTDTQYLPLELNRQDMLATPIPQSATNVSTGSEQGSSAQVPESQPVPFAPAIPPPPPLPPVIPSVNTGQSPP